MNQKILVTGATGAIGPVIVDSLLKEGFRVQLLIRRKNIDYCHPYLSKLDIVFGDITNFNDVFEATKGCDGIVHLAALLHIVNPPATLDKKYWNVNVEGTKNIVRAAEHNGVKKLVYSSTINVYGVSSGKLITEKDPPAPDTYYAKTKLAAEKIILSSKLRSTVLRLGAVYGAGVKGNYNRLLHSLAKKRFIPIGRGENRRTLVYAEDVAKAVSMVLKSPKSSDKIFNVTDGELHTVSEIIIAICTALGRKPPCFHLPLRIACGMARNIDIFTRAFSAKSLNLASMIEKYCEEIIVDGSFIQRELGFIPEYDLIEGWRETIGKMRQVGEL